MDLLLKSNKISLNQCYTFGRRKKGKQHVFNSGTNNEEAHIKKWVYSEGVLFNRN